MCEIISRILNDGNTLCLPINARTPNVEFSRAGQPSGMQILANRSSPRAFYSHLRFHARTSIDSIILIMLLQLRIFQPIFYCVHTGHLPGVALSSNACLVGILVFPLDLDAFWAYWNHSELGNTEGSNWDWIRK